MKPPQRVLIVDDDPSARQWLAAFMTSRGLAATAVGSGEEAVAEAKRITPGLVTLDLGLPGMDGLETLRALRAQQPRLAVLMLSGTGDTQAIVESVRLGAADFLRKPWQPEELHPPPGNALPRAPRRG